MIPDVTITVFLSEKQCPGSLPETFIRYFETRPYGTDYVDCGNIAKIVFVYLPASYDASNEKRDILYATESGTHKREETWQDQQYDLML